MTLYQHRHSGKGGLIVGWNGSTVDIGYTRCRGACIAIRARPVARYHQGCIRKNIIGVMICYIIELPVIIFIGSKRRDQESKCASGKTSEYVKKRVFVSIKGGACSRTTRHIKIRWTADRNHRLVKYCRAAYRESSRGSLPQRSTRLRKPFLNNKEEQNIYGPVYNSHKLSHK